MLSVFVQKKKKIQEKSRFILPYLKTDKLCCFTLCILYTSRKMLALRNADTDINKFSNKKTLLSMRRAGHTHHHRTWSTDEMLPRRWSMQNGPKRAKPRGRSSSSDHPLVSSLLLAANLYYEEQDIDNSVRCAVGFQSPKPGIGEDPLYVHNSL